MHTWAQQHGSVFALFAVLFAAIWLMVVLWSVSFITGWHTLAQRFTLQGDFPSERWRFQTALMKHKSHYNNVLTVGASPVGFYLSVAKPFGLFHPPLFIPWREITHTHAKIWWKQMVRFELGRENPVPFIVGLDLAGKIEKAAGQSWPAEQLG
jgi:hypothetical protein